MGSMRQVLLAVGMALLAIGTACGVTLAGGEGDPAAAMRTKPLRWSKHARCRMECRRVDEGEVRAALAHGTRDPTRTRHEPGRCPTHALAHRSDDGQDLRVVFAACEDETVVVTVIDLGTDWPCGAC